jgi:NTE family protein
MPKRPPPRPASYDRKVALLLQGGGALGSYQAGVYAALAQSDYLPDWVAGISIGAINAALIAGNPPAQRVARLRAFWESITAPSALWPGWLGLAFGNAWGDNRKPAALNALLLGQPGFFQPRPPLDWWAEGGPASIYDTTELRATLERLVDFGRLNNGEVRYACAAVNVATGNFAWFDSARQRIGPEHIMASGALPPGFPAVEIDGESWWDGGLVSNTPLQYVVEYYPRDSRLCFQVDLFPARGKVPQNLAQVQERDKDIRYSSRTRAATDKLKLEHDLRYNINLLWEALTPEQRAQPAAQHLYNFGCETTMDIVQLIHRADPADGDSKDYEFSRATMAARWAQGEADMRHTLAASPWLAPMPPGTGARLFDVARPPGG